MRGEMDMAMAMRDEAHNCNIVVWYHLHYQSGNQPVSQIS